MKADFRPTSDDYEEAFTVECAQRYPVVDAFEQRLGYAVKRDELEEAARVLACPVKANPPCWQHGRVLYAMARKFLSGKPSGCWTFLDIGTAKGFSALCLQWALMDHAGGALTSGVTSVDVIDPDARVRRNTVVELDGSKTLAEILSPWPETTWIKFEQSTGIDWLTKFKGEVDVAFVDGKHSGDVVAKEGRLIAERQQTGDAVMFDDIHLPDVATAVQSMAAYYELEEVRILPHRAYAIGVRR